MAQERIRVRGAREHNLKDVDIDLPRDKFVVITGPSGSGKSTLAFDTIFAEGQRRYMESLSSYARQFLGQMEKPQVDHIDGLSPAISIDQKATSHNPRSTVGTVTEIYDYLRLLYANLGEPHCPECGRPVAKQSAQSIADQVLALPKGTKYQILAPIVRERKGTYKKQLEELVAKGLPRVRINGTFGSAEDDWELARYKKHTIEAVVDRLVAGKADPGRVTEAVEQALKLAEGVVTVWTEGEGDTTYSEALACTHCNLSLPELTHRSFSFNAPQGACETCSGLGTTMEIDPDKVIVDRDAPLADGGINKRATMGTWLMKEVEQLGVHLGFTLDDAFNELTEEQQEHLLYGSDEEFKQVYASSKPDSTFHWEGYDVFTGLVNRLERRFKDTESEGVRARLTKFLSTKACHDCNGQRLSPTSLAVTIRDKNLAEVCAMPVGELVAWFTKMEKGLKKNERVVAGEVLREITARLSFMADVGLEYLTLARNSSTLSGGEAQRIRLATQIGSGLVGVLYVLDEPTIGLHHRDNQRLIRSLKGLRDLGNTLLVVEHDLDVIRQSDHVVDLGPGSGELGGEVSAQGTPAQLARRNSMTGKVLAGKLGIEVPEERRSNGHGALTVRGAAMHNLQGIDVDFPLGCFVCVTGVSGSGKSTLVNEILYKALARRLYSSSDPPGPHKGIDGLDEVDKVVLVDQSPIGRTPRSNPATYTGAFTPIRDLFAATPEAKKRGFKKGRFSFNVRGGRCETCQGDGYVTVEMHFLADVFVPCEECDGARYNRETLEVKYKGKTIKDVLDMTVTEALAFFEPVPAIANKLRTLHDVGLGYVRLGQPAPTLSGGEAQRVSRRATGGTVYILDEPTTGLHVVDIEKLLDVLHRLVDGGNTAIVIEHNLDVIKTADWVLDLGPEGGVGGGLLVGEGTPEQIAKLDTHTGAALREVLTEAAKRR